MVLGKVEDGIDLDTRALIFNVGICFILDNAWLEIYNYSICVWYFMANYFSKSQNEVKWPRTQFGWIELERNQFDSFLCKNNSLFISSFISGGYIGSVQ